MKKTLQFSACLATLATIPQAEADVIYSNLLDTAIPTTFDGVTINVNGGTLNPFFGGVAVANNTLLQPLRAGTDGLATILNLSFGSTINSSSLYLSSGDGGSQDHLSNTFTAGQEGYIGFKLNGTNYGWMRVIFTDNTGGAMVKDWAYDNSGSGISVGGIQQVGQNVILSSAFTLGSVLANSGGTTNLVKNSVGTNTLTATSTYTGTTTVNAGKMVMGTSAAHTFATSGVTVASAATLGGSGTIAGNLVLNAESSSGAKDGGKLAPGNDPGVLTASGTTTFNTGSIFAWTIDTDTVTPGRGTEYAGLNTTSVSGTDAVFQIVTSDSEGFGDNFWETNHTWSDIFKDAAGSESLGNDWLSMFSSFAFSNGTSTISAPTNGSFTWTNSGNTLSWTAVPEPTAPLGGLLIAVGLLRRRRA